MIITIDTGTTNTRVALFDGKQRVDLVKANIGVRNTSIDGNNQQLISIIANAISQLKKTHSLQDSDIEAILAAGMITSNLGLYEVPHLVAPVSLESFANNIKSVVIPEVSALPIHFIPGVKNLDTENLQSVVGLDIMRGEEVEALAIVDLFNIEQGAIIALPGSHSKFVAVDSKQTVKLPPAKPEAYWMTPSKGLILRPRRGSFTSLGL
ncbi:2-dehydro-3-deoxygalactonokinase, partial [Vibrio mediterranei]|uniref:2-dehydro-3-deoxygalactonokinase n=1 Tax=Vibrio mediterranei TaxID=689 RepID=UPI00148D4572